MWYGGSERRPSRRCTCQEADGSRRDQCLSFITKAPRSLMIHTLCAWADFAMPKYEESRSARSELLLRHFVTFENKRSKVVRLGERWTVRPKVSESRSAHTRMDSNCNLQDRGRGILVAAVRNAVAHDGAFCEGRKVRLLQKSDYKTPPARRFSPSPRLRNICRSKISSAGHVESL